MKQIVIAHLYPNEMNIYGDMGNIIVLIKRLEWRGFKVDYHLVGIGDTFDFRTADIVFGGGGQDKGQALIAKDLLKRQTGLYQAAKENVVMLMVCGLYQLFGHGFKTQLGELIPGIGIFNALTVASDQRMIGNVVVKTTEHLLVGFENHSGKTYLESDQNSLGRVVKGAGNDGVSGYEGAVINNVYGTYLHGSLLPKNPGFADLLLRLALERKYGLNQLEPIDDYLEKQAARIASKRPY